MQIHLCSLHKIASTLNPNSDTLEPNRPAVFFRHIHLTVLSFRQGKIRPLVINVLMSFFFFLFFLNCVSLKLLNFKLHNSRRVCTNYTGKSTQNYVFFLYPPPRKHAHKFESVFKRLHSDIQENHLVGNETGCLYRQEFAEGSKCSSNTTIVYRYSTP